MSDTSSRLLRLLSLLQMPRTWPGDELAARLRVSRRTIRRDVERLRDLGYPVRTAMGAGGGYRLVAGAAMPPLLLSDEEAVAIAVGLRAAAAHAIEGMEDASVRALTKLEQEHRAGPDRPAVHGASARWRGSGGVRAEQAVLDGCGGPCGGDGAHARRASAGAAGRLGP